MEEYREALQLNGSELDELARAVRVARVLVEEVERDPGLGAGQLLVLQLLHFKAVDRNKKRKAAEKSSS